MKNLLLLILLLLTGAAHAESRPAPGSTPVPSGEWYLDITVEEVSSPPSGGPLTLGYRRFSTGKPSGGGFLTEESAMTAVEAYRLIGIWQGPSGRRVFYPGGRIMLVRVFRAIR